MKSLETKARSNRSSRSTSKLRSKRSQARRIIWCQIPGNSSGKNREPKFDMEE
jgi:hypothetical protein